MADFEQFVTIEIATEGRSIVATAITFNITTIAGDDGATISSILVGQTSVAVAQQPTDTTTLTESTSQSSNSPSPRAKVSSFNTLSIVTSSVKGGNNKGSLTTEAIIYPAQTTINQSDGLTISTESPIASADASGLNLHPKSGAAPIAGTAVGGVIGGLLLGVLIAWFLLRKKIGGREFTIDAGVEKDGNGHHRNGGVGGGAGCQSAPTAAGAVVPAIGVRTDDDGMGLKAFMPLPTPDKELAGEVRSLGQLIEQHVENHYHHQAVQASTRSLSVALQNLGVGVGGTGMRSEDVAGMAVDARTRSVALRHVLAGVLFRGVDFRSRTRLTMLPAPVAAFLQSVPQVERMGGNEEAMNLALSRWRTLGAFLLNPNRSERTTLVPSETAIAPQASALAGALNSFLEPFISSSMRQQQGDHLQAVIMECAKFGYTLFSQSGEWRLNLNGAGGGQREAVVCAGLDKISTNEGVVYGEPVKVLPARFVEV